jgi:alpha-1,3-glucan synthase
MYMVLCGLSHKKHADCTSTLQVWGMNPDGQPDQSFIYGDIDNDTVLDRLPPDALSPALINMTELPPSPYLAYKISIDDASYKYKLIPTGSRLVQVLVFALLWSLPVLTGAISTWTYMGAFYGVKFNKIGLKMPKGIPSFWNRHKFSKLADDDVEEVGHRMRPLFLGKSHQRYDSAASGMSMGAAKDKRRKVIIATMEYDIEDWSIKVKIVSIPLAFDFSAMIMLTTMYYRADLVLWLSSWAKV